MKNLYIFLISLFFSIALTGGLASCRRASDNGKIDGNWQVVEITNLESQQSVQPKRMFMAVQLELVQFRGGDALLTGLLEYKKGADKVAFSFPDNPSESVLAGYGLFDNPASFDIELLDSRSLVLRSKKSVISARRF